MTSRTIHGPDFAHILEPREAGAIRAALAANRPLLVRGEPGVGKTQLALAAAVNLNRPLVSLTVDANTEPREVMWTFDAVARLAEAQVASVTVKDQEELERRIDSRRFVRPGPLWWAFDWDSAAKQLMDHEAPPHKPDGWTPHQGVVVLIDEIDKAESELPNGLLEAFGARQFRPVGWSRSVQLQNVAPPLIVVTTNEERVLPDAFIRRCFVLRMSLPRMTHHNPQTEEEREQDQAFIDFLVDRGRAHFPDADEKLLGESAKMLLSDRRDAMQRQWSPLPGQAEYLDFLRAIQSIETRDDRAMLMQQVRQFSFRKSNPTA
ncbi:AAA family ATPase [Rhodopirellula baltica]|nr:AAA family ATPase [Rhodopirellula baltica]